MTYYYTHKSVHCQTLIKEATYSHRSESTLRSTSVSQPSRLRDLCKSDHIKTVRARGDDSKQTSFSRHNGADRHMNSESAAAYTRPADIQINPSKRRDWNEHTVPPITKKRFATDV